MILVFDEFQWLVEKSPELPSVLQELWDRHWSKSGRMFLILCGSYIGFMEREVLGKKSPLYGRRTGQIFLKPFGYRDAALFHPHASLVQRAATYFICGGIPLYLRYFEAGRSVLQNIEHLMLNEQAALYREPDLLLREELREVEKYYMILMALAGGALPSRDIARKAGIGDLQAYFGLCYESLCREALPLLYQKDNVSALYEVGTYWDSQVQIDVVGLRRDGWLDLGECKWGAVKPLVSAAAELEDKIRRYPNAENAAVGRHLFVRSFKAGRKRLPENVRIHTLDELYE
jgi:AAA+ ATPase superfamily predicted ATPase